MRLSKYKKELFDCLVTNGCSKNASYRFLRKSKYVTELILLAHTKNKITNTDKFKLLWGND